jgi:hypothetical protein
VDPTCADCQRWKDLFQIPSSLDVRWVRIGIEDTLRWIVGVNPTGVPKYSANPEINKTTEAAKLFYLEWGNLGMNTLLSQSGQRCPNHSVAVSFAGQDAIFAPRIVDHSTVDIGSVKTWMSLCTTQHGTACLVQPFPKLSSISLIDVEAEEVVAYKSIENGNYVVEYLCLSYVWGALEQEIERSGQKLLRVPKTIRDAMQFTRLLGKQYLWVDSVWTVSYVTSLPLYFHITLTKPV